MNATIPRRIIQVWGGGRDLSLTAKGCAANIKLLNPDFEYIMFNDNSIESFIDQHFPEYRSIFHSYERPIQRYDLFRYLAIYHLGGFYFDIDVLLVSSLVDLLHYPCVFPFEELTMYDFLRSEYRMDWGIGTYAFGAAAGHPFIRAIIENCLRAQRDPTWTHLMLRSIPRLFHQESYVLITTGPGLVSRTLAEYPDAGKHVKVLFPQNVCDPRSWFHFGSFGVHLMEGEWRDRRMIRRRLFSLWLSWKLKRHLKESIRSGKNRLLEFPKETF